MRTSYSKNYFIICIIRSKYLSTEVPDELLTVLELSKTKPPPAVAAILLSLTKAPSMVTPLPEVFSDIVSVNTALSLSFTPSVVTPLATVVRLLYLH